MKKKRKENERDRDKEDKRDKAGREIMESWGGTRDRKKRSDEQTPDLAPKAIRFMLPILITNDVGLSLIEKSLKSITANYERKDSTSKSFFDNRIKNVIFKIDGKQIVKVFPLLDYEIITINNDAIVNVRSGNMKHRINRDQMNRSDAIFDCHSNFALRLAFNEYITYDIVGNSEVAKVKLMLFTYLYKKYGIRDMVITESNVVGTYYPFDIYIKELRVKSIKRNLARIARPS